MTNSRYYRIAVSAEQPCILQAALAAMHEVACACVTLHARARNVLTVNALRNYYCHQRFLPACGNRISQCSVSADMIVCRNRKLI